MIKKLIGGIMLILLVLSTLSFLANAASPEYDLIVSASNAGEDADYFHVQVNVFNAGPDAVPQSDILLKFEIFDNQGKLVKTEGEQLFMSLSPSTSFSWIQKLPKTVGGKNAYKITLDPNNFLTETNEANNVVEGIFLDESFFVGELDSLEDQADGLQQKQKGLQKDYEQAKQDQNLQKLKEIEAKLSNVEGHLNDLKEKLQQYNTIINEQGYQKVAASYTALDNTTTTVQNDVKETKSDVQDEIKDLEGISQNVLTVEKVSVNGVDLKTTETVTIQAASELAVAIAVKNQYSFDVSEFDTSVEVEFGGVKINKYVQDQSGLKAGTGKTVTVLIPFNANNQGDAKVKVTVDGKAADGTNLGDAQAMYNLKITSTGTPSTPGNVTTEEQTYLDFKADYQQYDDDFDEYKKKYNSAITDNDDKDKEKYAEKLEKLEDKLSTLEDDIDEFIEDLEDKNDNKYNDLINKLEDLRDDVSTLRDDIDSLLNGKKQTKNGFTGGYEAPGAAKSLGAKDSSVKEDTVVVKTLDFVPPATQPVEESASWNNIRLAAYAVAGIIILLAIVIFLIAVLLR